MMNNYDIIIVGAGIVGLSTAYKLMKLSPELKLAIVEKEADVSLHQTGHNSGVLHSGIYYTPGSLKALNCQKGSKELREFADTYGIEYEMCGKVIVATSEDQIETLKGIYDRGVENGLKGLKLMNKEETLEYEPHVNCVQSIYVPQAGIIHYPDVANKIKELLIDHGSEFYFNNEVTEILEDDQSIIIKSKELNLIGDKVVICAGLYADKMARLSGEEVVEMIVPFRGEYYELEKEKQFMVNNLIYPVPDVKFPFLGVHYTRMIKGGIEAGPNAVLAFKREGYSRWQINFRELFESLTYSGFLKLASKFMVKGLGEMHRSFSKRAFVKALKHLITDVGYDDLKRGKSGVRAQALDKDGNMVDDFLVKRKGNIINVINAPSPAATASLAIGEYIAKVVLKD